MAPEAARDPRTGLKNLLDSGPASLQVEPDTGQRGGGDPVPAGSIRFNSHSSDLSGVIPRTPRVSNMCWSRRFHDDTEPRYMRRQYFSALAASRAFCTASR